MDWLPSQEFVFYRTYSRWVEELGRRETFPESVARYFAFLRRHFDGRVPEDVFARCERQFLELGAVGSMRAFWTAGPALEFDHICAYNCWSLAIKDVQSFAELFYILMCGSGCSFSVERQFIDQLPPVMRQVDERLQPHVVEDSRAGWANALATGLRAWVGGYDLEFDVSRVRPRGARLRTMGGRASGPGPLVELLSAVREIVFGAQGRHLSDVDCLDVGNRVAAAVEVGGVRRSAESTFSDLDSVGMRHAKDFPIPPHRYQSNNSAVYFCRPTREVFDAEWRALRASGSGERGIFNVQAAGRACARRIAPKLGCDTGDEFASYLRSNPCFEILLFALTGQACNVTEAVCRPGDTLATLKEKLWCATWLGAMQSDLTDFRYIRDSFRAACEEERLLGVSITGQMDNPELLSPQNLAELKFFVQGVALAASGALGINMPAAITTGKPSGTVSQLVDSASGMHARYAPYYIRRYRIGAVDPLFRMMRAQGVKFSPENGQRTRPEAEVDTWVVEFPAAAPVGAVTRGDVTAIDQLEWYLKMRRHWCEHNQSVTVYVRDGEWDAVREWVWENFDEVCGVAFLPYDGGKYEQAPYEEISREEYERRLAAFPKIDYSRLSEYEMGDQTTGARALACAGDACEI